MQVLPQGVERPVNVAYELYDYAWYFGLLALVGYVIYSPTPTGEAALREVFNLTSPTVFGGVTTAAMLFAGACAWRERWLPRGYTVLIIVSALWAGWFFAGWLLNDVPGRALVSALIYANIASRGYRLKARL